MNAVGNDNYRPGLQPPEPMKNGSGWLSSNMAQLMVFLNGLILTVTAFATLSVFIDEIVKEGLLKETEEIQEYIVSRYSESERSLHALSAIIGTDESFSAKKILSYTEEKTSGSENFDQIYLIAQNEKDKWKTKTLLKEEGEGDVFNSAEDFSNFVRSQINNTKNLQVITSSPESELSFRQNIVQVYDRSFVLVKKFKPGGYLAGVVRINRFMAPEWLIKKESIYDVQIIDSGLDVPIYSYQKELRNQTSSFTRYTNIIPVVFAGKAMDVKIGLVVGSRESFLQKIPLLMLLFGITLTLIGTLYVRNNQSQSQKLARMNKELAHKNFELSQEMSERERLNQVIQKSARENRAVINAVSDIIFEVSVEGAILFLNDSWKKVTGFDLERSIGRNLFDLLYVQDQDEQRQNFQQLIKGSRKSYRAFTRLRSVDGSFRAVELAISMVRQDENNDLRVVGTITDVEERRRAERALSEAEKKYRAIVENAAGGIYQVTPEGQFLSANPAFAKILGYDAPEEVLRDISDAHKQLYLDASARKKFLQEISVSDSSQNYESQITKKNGEVIWVSENVRPVKDDDGTLLFFEGSMDDVDQRKKAEIALTEAKTESDLANRAKSEFLTNMSHELRTPLNSVIGFSEIIKNETFGAFQHKEYKEYATDIYESGKRLLNVINEILDVSRIEAGERTLNEGAINLKETVEVSLGLTEGKIKANNIRVENKVRDPDLGLIGETQAVKQMLLNLMSNAVKFSPPGSVMTIDAEIDGKDRLRLSVTDTGVGLTEKEIEKALSPFGQLDARHKRSKSGTGLGLTLVSSLVGLHGGELELVSQKGIGTTATLIFPSKRVVYKRVIDQEKTDSESVTETKDA